MLLSNLIYFHVFLISLVHGTCLINLMFLLFIILTAFGNKYKLWCSLLPPPSVRILTSNTWSLWSSCNVRDHTHLHCIICMLLNSNTYLSNRSSCCKPLNTVIRWHRPRTHTSATSAFGATKSRLCLLRPWTKEKHTTSSIVCFWPGDFLCFLLTVRSILLNVSVFHPLRTSTISSTRTVKKVVKCQRAWLKMFQDPTMKWRKST